jgi:hypothetical protein
MVQYAFNDRCEKNLSIGSAFESLGLAFLKAQALGLNVGRPASGPGPAAFCSNKICQ